MCQSLITQIPKANKDCLLIENWRPVTLINNDAKLFAHIFAQRLKLCLPSIIDECQSGFMQGRLISNNIRLISDIIDYREYLNGNNFILFIDIYKALDTVIHNTLFDAIVFLKKGPNPKKSRRTIYSGCNSSVKLPGGTTHRLEGVPAAQFLFILVMEILTLHLFNEPFGP